MFEKNINICVDSVINVIKKKRTQIILSMYGCNIDQRMFLYIDIECYI